MTQGDLAALLPFALIALVFWFLIFRPARKRQRETMQTQASLEVGVRVMLTSGIFGEVVAVGDSEVEVEIAPDTVISVHRQAIGKVVPAEEPTDSATDDADDAAADEEAAADDTSADADDRADSSLPPTHQEKK